MLNVIPIFGWLLSFCLSTLLAIPFWFLWTCMSFGTRFFGFLPEQFHVISFWNCVGLFMVIDIAKYVIFPTARFNFNSPEGKK